MAASEVTLPLRIGARTLLTLRRRLMVHSLTIEEALAARVPPLPGHINSADLLLVRPSLAYIYALGAFDLFDRSAAVAKQGLVALGGGRLVRRIRR